MRYKILENNEKKILISENCNYYFSKIDGLMITWGKTKDDDPQYSSFGPFIVDIEISTICHGVQDIGPCKFCYKNNTGKGENMSLETFKKLFAHFPKSLTQIALGIGDLDSNPDMFPIFEYTKENGVIPNVTINCEGLTDEIAEKLVKVCGAIACSLYDKEKTYNAIQKLTSLGMKQVNIHFMLSEETFENAKQLLIDRQKDSRLKNLNAIVFLGIKNKGRAICNEYTKLSQEKFKKLIDYSITNNIGIGFDSCSAHKFLESIKENPIYKQLETLAEPCESGLFSAYFNVKGEFYPCSFMEGVSDWQEGIILKEDSNFSKDLWNHPRVVEWRNKLLKKCRQCPEYQI